LLEICGFLDRVHRKNVLANFCPYKWKYCFMVSFSAENGCEFSCLLYFQQKVQLHVWYLCTCFIFGWKHV